LVFSWGDRLEPNDDAARTIEILHADELCFLERLVRVVAELIFETPDEFRGFFFETKLERQEVDGTVRIEQIVAHGGVDVAGDADEEKRYRIFWIAVVEDVYPLPRLADEEVVVGYEQFAALTNGLGGQDPYRSGSKLFPAHVDRAVGRRPDR
jgi:hypothetical protein